jgi:hypothetical protein
VDDYVGINLVGLFTLGYSLWRISHSVVFDVDVIGWKMWLQILRDLCRDGLFRRIDLKNG